LNRQSFEKKVKSGCAVAYCFSVKKKEGKERVLLIKGNGRSFVKFTLRKERLKT